MSFVNPIIEQRADPWVLRHTDGQYYFTASVPAYDRIEIRRSETIQGLGRTSEMKTIWTRHASGEMSWHIWAPELHFINGKWYVYFAASREDSIWAIRIYALSNTSADPFEGEWVEEGQIKTDFESFSLDATTFEHRGKRYMVWAQKDQAQENSSELFLAEMISPIKLKLPATLISRPDLPWERVGHNVNEGPAVLIRNGRVFIAYSASATDHNYCMGMLAADADAILLDAASWTKTLEPVLCTSVADSEFGPGHNSFTVSEDGKHDVLIYHARDYRDVDPDPLRDPNRHTRARYIRWRDDGTPDFTNSLLDTPKQSAR
ncbi:MAG: glycoside hydrolase family 43 protein [Burkholderiales bacterium]|nr:glycoside hydrolase family 43 protein [Phycisphaerae bacterium]